MCKLERLLQEKEIVCAKMFGLDDLEWSLPRLQGTHATQSWLVKPWPWAILRVYGGPTGLWWTQCQLCGCFLSHESLGQDSAELLITLLFPAGLPKLTGELAAPWSCLPDYCSIHQEWECLTLTAEHFLRVLFFQMVLCFEFTFP